MATRITTFKAQKKPQSCTAIAIKVTLHELGVSTYSGIDGGELALWEQLKRSNTIGEEEIMPHAAILYLQSRGCTVELIEDKIRTAPLSLNAPGDYSQYTTGLSTNGIVAQNRALDPANDFLNAARVFVIVGFLGRATVAGPLKLLTHTVLCRLHGGSYWTLNPDGATDKAYSLGEVQTFLAHANPMAPVKPEFASKKCYTYTGIAYRVTFGRPVQPVQAEESVWAPGEANPPYDRLLKAKCTFRGQTEQQFKRELEVLAAGAVRKSKQNNLRVLIFGPRGELDEITKWTEATVIALNRSGYQFRISRVFFDHGTKQVRFYDHLRSE
jgi:hypothetical protein